VQVRDADAVRMRLVAYKRVSTDRQAEKGYGLDVQHQAIKTWCKANGHRLVGVHTDEGESGSNGLSTRIALADALADVRQKRADGIVVFKLDRFSRDAILQEQLLAEVWRTGGEVFSTMPTENNLRDDPEDPSRKLMRRILGAVAEYEKDMVVLRMKGGRRRKAEKGGFAYGSPHYGTRAVEGDLVEDEREQATLARIRELHAAGASLRQMCATLTAEGHRPKRSDRWHPESLKRIIVRL
jgi:DNA invertase Pin-like site-specific DNA recombinase